jgi:hypothetical protein
MKKNNNNNKSKAIFVNIILIMIKFWKIKEISEYNIINNKNSKR